MALQVGNASKGKIVVVGALIVVALGGVSYELYNQLSTGPVPVARPAVATGSTSTARENVPAARTTARQGRQTPAAAGEEAKKLTNPGIDPTIHFGLLAQSEDVEYEGTGRNIFSAESAPAPIPKPIVSPRPGPGAPDVTAASGPPPPPKAPAIDLKYFGYTEGKDKSMVAFFVHGDDIFMATAGQIVDHRYKVGSIKPTTVDVTDMNYNNTQTLNLTGDLAR
jgi:hypothetical protein